jgi:5-methylthioribose kinase
MDSETVPDQQMTMELNIENFDALRDYLIEHNHTKTAETLSFQKLHGGVSNRTVKVAWPDGTGWVLKQALAKLRVNVDWFSSPERIKVEAKALREMNRLAPPETTPAFVFEDASNHLMAMEAVPEAHKNWKTLLLSGHVVTNHFEQFGLLLGTVHRRSSESSFELRSMFADTTYFQNLRLDPYYLYTAQQVPTASAFLHQLVRETLNQKYSLVHGDFSPKNTLIYDNKVILLDYEVVHFGDPAFDLGFALTHFLSKLHHLPKERVRLAAATELFWQVYSLEIAHLNWASALEARAVRHSLGCLLARVAGKSTLEYLSADERTRQQAIVLALIENPPGDVASLVEEFVRMIENHV